MSNLKRKKMEEDDRISLLPDCLLRQILSNINIKQVVQTCVLSKRWKTLWTHIPALNFLDDGSYGRVHSNHKPTCFKHFVIRVLSEHRGEHIQKLSYVGHDDLLAESLICHARRHNVGEIYIHTYVNGFRNTKHCLSGCSSLTVLKISCGVADYLGALALPSLKVLEIVNRHWPEDQNVKKNNLDAKFEDMFSGCPNLESLVLSHHIFRSATICAPKLYNFELCVSSIWGLTSHKLELRTPNLKSVKFSNVLPTMIMCDDSDFSYLHKVNIQVEDCYFQPISKGKDSSSRKNLIQNLIELLRVFRNTRCFTLPLNSLQFVRWPLPNLKHLKLKTKIPTKGTALDIPISILAYLQNCPNLETLAVLNEDEEIPLSKRKDWRF